MKYNKLFIIAGGGIIITSILFSSFVYAEDPKNVLEQASDNLDLLREIVGLDEQLDVRDIFVNVINISLTIVGLLFMALLIYGGTVYMTSAGMQDRIDRGKKILTWAIIGIAIVLLSFSISKFVTDALTFSTDTGI